ncbi:hypothetical protein DFH07DRAFT_961326 [Mycena maculata]|uniref:NmrA-like domain-containing protein n=1 Tax=Mycena maculata TaxID=230809 RepID=A0AAD7IWF6_9AGAR|nr:hypothetical protein DFH07DRAFT_961326 [Mycena maculata]
MFACRSSPQGPLKLGSAVFNALLTDRTFVPRAITRTCDDEAAQKLRGRGVEVVNVGSFDKASLANALRIRGSEAVVAVSMLPFKGGNEFPNEALQGKNMVEVATQVGVKLFIFSISELPGSKYETALFYKRACEDPKSSDPTNASLPLSNLLEDYWTNGFRRKTPTAFDFVIVNHSATDVVISTWVDHAATLTLLENYAAPDPSNGLRIEYSPHTEYTGLLRRWCRPPSSWRWEASSAPRASFWRPK